jgi:hypothetical protein
VPPEYDVTVAYRIYPKISKVPPVFPNDKYKLSELCLKTFKDSLSSLKVKMFVLLDDCPPSYEDLFKQYFDEQDLEFIRLNGVGNRATFDMQIDILLDQNFSEIVYFAEDDYLYLPHQFESMVKFLRDEEEVDFVSPYDHLDYYLDEIHNYKSQIRFFGNRHWRTVAGTCLTFLTTKSVLRSTKNVFKTYASRNTDGGIWLSLTKHQVFNLFTIAKHVRHLNDKKMRGKLIDMIGFAWLFCWRQVFFGKRRKLWVPIPSIATHMEGDYIAPTFCWVDDPSAMLEGLQLKA